jgi:CheY-like chemotaxis protein
MSPAIIAVIVVLIGAGIALAVVVMGSSKKKSGGEQGGGGQQGGGGYPPQHQQQQGMPYPQQGMPYQQQQQGYPQQGMQQPGMMGQPGGMQPGAAGPWGNPFPPSMGGYSNTSEATLPPGAGPRPGAPSPNAPAPPLPGVKPPDKDRKRTVAMAFNPGSPGDQAPPGSMHYTPVLTTIFGETNPSRLVIETNEIIIGRASEADYSLDDDAASRQHAKLIYANFMKPDEQPLVNIVDMNSRNGVMVNGQKVVGSMVLPDNARIVIGQIQMGFYMLGFPKQGINIEAPSQRAAAGPSRSNYEAGAGAQARGAAPAAPASKICVVDNDFVFASDLRMKLDKTGRYNVVVYRSLDTALRGFSSGPPQMLLLDAEMPGVDTLETLRTLKADPNWAGVPIILLFNETNPDQMRAALKAGAQSYLTKPISNLSLLTSRIDIHMNINRMIAVRK